MEKSLIELGPSLAKLRATIKGVANWIERVDVLRNSMPATLPGQPRMFGVLHAKELMFMAAFVKGGMRPAAAAAYASAMIIDVKRYHEMPQWLVVAAGDFKSAVPTDAINVDQLTEHFGVVPLTMIPLRAIDEMVDELYKVA